MNDHQSESRQAEEVPSHVIEALAVHIESFVDECMADEGLTLAGLRVESLPVLKEQVTKAVGISLLRSYWDAALQTSTFDDSVIKETVRAYLLQVRSMWRLTQQHSQEDVPRTQQEVRDSVLGRKFAWLQPSLIRQRIEEIFGGGTFTNLQKE